MKCDENHFFNENIGECFSCSSVCDDLEATGNSRTYCETLCPDYNQNPVALNIIKTKSGSHHLEIILPVIFFSLLFIVITGVIIRKKIRNNRYFGQRLDRVVYTRPKPLPLTQEEVGNRDNGRPIDTTRSDFTLNGSIGQDESEGNQQQETQTGLSEIHCNPS